MPVAYHARGPPNNTPWGHAERGAGENRSGPSRAGFPPTTADGSTGGTGTPRPYQGVAGTARACYNHTTGRKHTYTKGVIHATATRFHVLGTRGAR